MILKARPVPSLRLLWAAAVLTLAFLVWAGRAGADQPSLNDIRLTLRARQALYQDKALAQLNLGISVRSGVAVVWGRVPSAAVGKRAEALVRKVPGVLEVRSELQVTAPDDPMTDFLNRVLSSGQGPTVESLVHESCRPTGCLTSHWPDADPGVRPPPVVALMPPILVAPPPGNATPPAPEPGQLVLAVEHLRQGDARFEAMRAEIQAGVVRLRGTVRRWEDLTDFSKAISTLPGVRGVLVSDVRLGADHGPR